MHIKNNAIFLGDEMKLDTTGSPALQEMMLPML